MKAGVNYAHAPVSALTQVVVLRLHLDDFHNENGPLQVIPNFHRNGVLTDEEVAKAVLKQALRKFLVKRGGVIAMRPLIMHAFSKAKCNDPRRVLHIEYTTSLRLGQGLTLAIV